MFKTISNYSITEELIEKKSKFIVNIFYVETQEEAEEKIKEMKKQYFDAKHNCFAYSIYSENGIINRFSDDGEPSGTAGSPMLNILNSKKLCNIVVIVTRYFGGILLGTGGLVRAYTGVLQCALDKIKEIEKDLGLEVKIEIGYQDLEKLKYYLKKNNFEITKIEYKENVYVFIEITEKDFENLKNNVNNFNFKILNIEVIKNKLVNIS